MDHMQPHDATATTGDTDQQQATTAAHSTLPHAPGDGRTRRQGHKAGRGVGVGVAGVAVAAKVGALKALLTVGSLLVSILVYAAGYGLPFAVGLVALLFFHEAGHYLAYRRKGITPDAMIFIPFVGAAVITRRHTELSALDDVVISLAGPVVGGLAAAACLPLAYVLPQHGPFLVALAATGFLINAINLIPLGPLDGAHVVRAILGTRASQGQQATGAVRAVGGLLLVATAGLLVGGVVVARGSLGDALAAGTALFHVYAVPTAHASPDGITVDRQGVVWFTERHGNKIGRLDPTSGRISEYPIPTAASAPLRLAVSTDGTVWFTESGANKIGRLTPDGQIREFALPRLDAYPWDIIQGPDGAVWFIEHNVSTIGRITATGAISEFPLAHGTHPSGLTVGPDHALWFVEDDGHARGLGRITTGGAVKEYTLPVTGGGPQMITTGDDGLLYASLVKANALLRITLTAAAPRLEVFSLPAPPTATAGQRPTTTNNPFSLAAGPGGVWATQLGENALARLAPDGTVAEYLAFGAENMQNTFPAIVARAPDGTLWYSASDDNDENNRIVHLTGTPSAF